MKPRSHQVAQTAFKLVEARKTFGESKQYGALAHKLPVLILQNGLAQATGYLISQGNKGRGEHLALLDDLAQVLKETGEGGYTNGNALHTSIIEADTAKTMHLTRRCLEAASSLKRYVQGVLKVDATGAKVGVTQ